MAQVGTLTNIISGPCDIKLNGTSVGHTLDNATVTHTAHQRERKVMQYGTSRVGTIYTGGELKVDFTIAEATATHLALLLPTSPYFGKGTVGSDIAASAPDLQVITIGGSDSITLYNAVREGDLQVVWDGGENERAFKVTFVANFDMTKEALGIGSFA